MLKERAIHPSWVEKTITAPEKIEDQSDGTRHFLARIAAHGDRWLRVVVNVQAEPNKAVTTFFDRRVSHKT